MWTTFDKVREGDVFKLVDHSQAGVYAIRSLDPLRVESVRWGHQIPVHDFAPDKPVLITNRSSYEIDRRVS